MVKRHGRHKGVRQKRNISNVDRGDRPRETKKPKNERENGIIDEEELDGQV